jgi:hypothetical protein
MHLEPIIRVRKIQLLRVQLALRLSGFCSLGKRWAIEPLTDQQRSEIVRRQNELLKEGHFLQLAIDLLERQAKEDHACRTGVLSSAALRNYVFAAIRPRCAASPLARQ